MSFYKEYKKGVDNNEGLLPETIIVNGKEYFIEYESANTYLEIYATEEPGELLGSTLIVRYDISGNEVYVNQN